MAPRFEQKRRCRICRCSEDDPCWEARTVPHPLAPQVPIPVRRFCQWVGPDLCSFCAADGGPDTVSPKPGPDGYSGLVGPDGEPLRWAKDLPR